MFTLTWLKDATERALTSAAWTALSIAGGDKLDVFHADWRAITGAAAGSAVLSLLKSVAVGAAPGGTPGSATPVNLTK
ncbi:holin [Mycolicibacterium canariasense]|uniref:Holin n=1 Tax=Mycolicibacterium canariasense TaxID=228230 RepID=A0A100WIH5_MYCCR|nr:holin [Mycolicibacterium canariasense]MCV7210523.1 hypothetical protein [Mycolicibacterium canariasense]ORU96140.1 hypothetical protein AWB94_31240 [Mycolicibacterium canariasense]GAS98916.1 holin [Mycolicibacterium canariasense]